MATLNQESCESQDGHLGGVAEAVAEAAAASGDLADVGARSTLLRAIAAALEAGRGGIIAAAAAETALTPEELAPEFGRMVADTR